MAIVAKLDELGKPAWIALMILGFFIWWPLGLATLAFIIGSGRMTSSKGGMSRWYGAATAATNSRQDAFGALRTKGSYLLSRKSFVRSQ